MSIATLKRKTMNGNPRMSPLSGQGPLGFALNGTLRISGWVGPTNLGLDHQSSNYNTPTSVRCCTNDSNIIKKSVMNTRGMLSARIKGFPQGNFSNNLRYCSTAPQNWVQAIDNGLYQSNTAAQQTARVRQAVNTATFVNPTYVKVSDGNGGFIYILATYVGGVASVDASGNATYTKHCVKQPYITPWETCANGPGQIINKPGQGGTASGLMLLRGCSSKVIPTNKANVSSGAALSQGEYITTRYLTRFPDTLNTLAPNQLPKGKLCFTSNTWWGCSKNPTQTVEYQINTLGYYPPHFPPPGAINNLCLNKYMNVIEALKAGVYVEPKCV